MHLEFTIDGTLYDNLSYSSQYNGVYTYNSLLFARDSLLHAPHTLEIRNGRERLPSLLLLDYLVYTT